MVGSSLWAALARSRPQALWALASNSLCLALVALTLRAPLMASAWGISTLGLAALACHAADAPSLTHDNSRRHWPVLTIVVIGALLLVVGGLMIAVDSPILVALFGAESGDHGAITRYSQRHVGRTLRSGAVGPGIAGADPAGRRAPAREGMMPLWMSALAGPGGIRRRLGRLSSGDAVRPWGS